MKKEGQIQSYRIYNTGEEEPTFEVRTQVDGKPTWMPASALATGPQDEGDDLRHQDRGGEAAGPNGSNDL